jgi:hypothetical protein
MDSERTLHLLEELEKMGFNDDAFGRLHHKRETITGMRKYCVDHPTRSFGEANERVYERLAFVLNASKELKLSRDQAQLFNTLAEAAFDAIPPNPKGAAKAT